MCLAIPGKVLEIESDGNNALVDFDGVKRNVVIGLCEGVGIGTYVIVHAGYAIETVDEKDALESIDTWRKLLEDDSFDGFEKEDIL